MWTSTQNELWLVGETLLRQWNLSANTFTAVTTGQGWVSYCIRGTGENDVFIAGQSSECTHYNGSTWYLYPQLKTLGGGNVWWYCIFPTKDFVVVGGINLTALNGFPIIVRGYR